MLAIGSLVEGKYKILNVIGQGGMSIVYLAMNERANKQWAIKEVRKSGIANYQLVRQSLIVETNMLKKLSHKYLPSVVDVIDYEDSILIVMDYIEGNPLSVALEDYGVLPQEYVIEWAKQLCEVLGYLHSRKPSIVYRDLKPGNIMLKPDGCITLIDFGTAREYKNESFEDTTCLGTKGYAAPEQFGGLGQTDARTDIYCLGMTLYHLVTGHNPSEPPFEIFPIRYWNEHLAIGLEKIIEKCIMPNPEDRYQSCSEIMYDLEHYKELGSEVKKGAFFKVMLFGLASVMSIGCFGLSSGYSSRALSVSSSGYKNIIVDVDQKTSIEDKIVNYQEAMILKPEEEAAYLGLLENVFLQDEVFLREESDRLIEVLYTKTKGKSYIETLKNTNPKAYADFCYRLGIAYFYCYEGNGNKQMATKWLVESCRGDYLSESQKLRAERLGKISSYYGKLSVISKSGDSKVSYRQYWDDLCAVSKGDIAAKDNETTALIIYRELVSQLHVNIEKFRRDGVLEKEMNSKLLDIDKHLQSDFKKIDTANIERVEQLLKEVEEDIVQAKKDIGLAFELSKNK